MSVRVPTYPWPRHPEFYRRQQLVNSRLRQLAERGYAVTYRGSDISMGLDAAMQPEPDDLQFVIKGAAAPIAGQRWKESVSAQTDAFVGKTRLGDWYYRTGATTGAWREYDDDTVKVVDTSVDSYLRNASPYWGYTPRLLPVEPLPDNQLPRREHIAWYRAFFNYGSERTHHGSHIRLRRDGSAVWEGDANWQADRFVSFLNDSVFVEGHIYQFSWYASQVNEAFASSGWTVVPVGHPYPDWPDPRNYSAGLYRHSGSNSRDVSGKWIDVDGAILTGMDSYASIPSDNPRRNYQGVVIQRGSGSVLLDDGRLFSHAYDGTRTLVDTDVYVMQGSNYWLKNGTQKQL